MNFKIFCIGDYGDDLAFNEVTQRLNKEFFGHSTEIHKQKVAAFSTVETGFTLGQLAMNTPTDPEGFSETIKFFVNTAPRKDDPLVRVGNQGEGLVYFKLPNGVEGVAVNSGWSLSFIKDAATEIRQVNCGDAGSQFRSRDLFPKALADIVLDRDAVLGDEVKDTIPDFPENHLAFTDGYGNLKTSIPADILEDNMGKHVKIYMNRKTIFAKISKGIFGVEEGEFALSVGSSGWTKPDGEEVKFVEIVQRGGSAAESVHYPPAGKRIAWTIVE